jgi:NADH-quinone oxidoreductase subunit E
MRVKRLPVSKEAVTESNINLGLIEPVLQKYKGKRGVIIPVLQSIQHTYGFLPKTALEKMATEMNLKLSDIFGVATFYAQFRLNAVGKHIIKVCHGTACHVQNANEITEAITETLHIKDGETTPDGVFTLETVACLGCCSLAPVMMIGDNTYGKLTGASSVKIIKEIHLKEIQQS